MGSLEQPDRQQLITNAKAQLKEDGWCRLPSVLDPQQTKDVLARLWKAKAASEAQGDPTHLSFLDPNASNVRVFYLMQLDKIFLELIQHPETIDMVKSVLGDNFLISNFTANIARPGSKSMGLHSDMSLIMPDPWTEIVAMNCIWCLTDVYFENGATLFIPGSNKWKVRDDIPKDARKRLQPFEAKAGDVIVMDGRVWHTSGANITADQDRALCFGYYTAPHLRQQVNWSAKLDPQVQKELSPELREWLGVNVDANLGAALNLKYLDDQFPEEKTVEQVGSGAMTA